MNKIEVKASMHPELKELAEGWRHLQEKATHAAVRFSDDTKKRVVNWSYLAVDLYESDKLLVLHMEVAGMEAADFDITIFGNNLVISGTKKPLLNDETKTCMYTERAYGEFERSIPLLKPVDESQATANYLQGVLTVSLPVLKDGFCRRIEVQGE